MPFEMKARVPNQSLRPVIFLRWVAIVAQLLLVMGLEANTGIVIPAAPVLLLIGASLVFNTAAMITYRHKLVAEPIIRLHVLFDILQFSGILLFTGGTDNPFSILLLAPLAMAASMLSLYNLCLVIISSLGCLSVLAFAAWPLQWHGQQPFLPPQFTHGTWLALFIALVVVSFIIWRLAMEGRRINTALQKAHTILEERRRMSALGALAAAAVHELGSPLGTIAIITRELEHEILSDDPIAEDVALLKTEVEKCKAILAELARTPDQDIEKIAPLRLDRLVMEIASPYQNSNSRTALSVSSTVPENLPECRKHPNLEYGLGNLIGNALSFAQEAVTIAIEGSASSVEISIRDDGPGFPHDTLKTIGQPYISTREAQNAHMGLGIFISLNLLEATGATLVFANHPQGGGHIRVIWPRSELEALASSG